MKNWAGNLTWTPKNVLAPSSVEELQKIIKETKGHVRTRGSGHSWTELISTSDSFVHLDNLQGILNVDKHQAEIRAWAGTKLNTFTKIAFENGLSMANQGDIDKQSLAGASSTGTHGTGETLQSVANQLTVMKLVTGQGEVKELKGADLKAAGVSIGSLGIISECTVKMLPAYKLKVETFPEVLSESLKHHTERLRANRHLEMFYFPVGDWSIVKTMNITDEAPSKKGVAHKFNDVVLENWVYEGINVLAQKTGKYKALDKVMRSFVFPQTKIGHSHQMFPTERTVRFMEMEFNVPTSKFEVVLDELKVLIKNKKFQTLFPIEIRFVAKDDLWLSPAFERESVYFAVHTYVTENYRPYFDACQEIFKRHQGRPHWGKWHSLKADYFQTVYPKWDDFLKVRAEYDPEKKFINLHLRDLFGI